MKHVYLSPHLDDAVLSCGGAIHRHTAAGEPVLVITVFAGEASGGELSSFALKQHEYWGNHPWPMAMRRAEDVAALTFLGAKGRHLDCLDAVYRATPKGQWMYSNLETLMGEVDPDDPLALAGAEELAARLADLIPLEEQPVLYAPLAVGRHVDHQIVHTVAREFLAQTCRVAFYEDYPYAERPDALDTALAASEAQSWRMEPSPLDASDLSAKVSALAYYRTQLSILFGGAEAMPSRVWAFAASRSSKAKLAERVWWPPAA